MPLNAIDRDDIRQLLARYCHTLDFTDLDGFVGCFTPDGYFSPESSKRWEGHAELREFAQACGKHYVGHIRHFIANSLIEGEGDEAYASTYMFSSRDGGTPEGEGQSPFSRFLSSGLYQDRLVKIDGRWFIAERTFRYDGDQEIIDRVGKPIRVGALFDG